MTREWQVMCSSWSMCISPNLQMSWQLRLTLSGCLLIHSWKPGFGFCTMLRRLSMGSNSRASSRRSTTVSAVYDLRGLFLEASDGQPIASLGKAIWTSIWSHFRGSVHPAAMPVYFHCPFAARHTVRAETCSRLRNMCSLRSPHPRSWRT